MYLVIIGTHQGVKMKRQSDLPPALPRVGQTVVIKSQNLWGFFVVSSLIFACRGFECIGR